MLMQILCSIAPRRYRVYRLLSRLAADRYEIYRVEGGLIYLNLHESAAMVQRAMSAYEPAKHALIRRRLRPGMTFIDVGANKGDFTLLAAHLAGDSGRVISIEPEPENHSILERSIALNDYSNIRVLQVALSDRDGTANLQIGSTSGSHTLSPEFNGLRTVAVPTRTLDGIVAEQQLASVDMIKIDVQGFELAVLHGAQRALRENPRAILLLDLPKQDDKRRAIADYLAQFDFAYFANGDEHAPRHDLPPAALEVVALRMQYHSVIPQAL
jgi:FkbM family methyltransferase